MIDKPLPVETLAKGINNYSLMQAQKILRILQTEGV